MNGAEKRALDTVVNAYSAQLFIDPLKNKPE